MKLIIKFSEIELNGQTALPSISLAKAMLKKQYEAALDQIDMFEATYYHRHPELYKQKQNVFKQKVFKQPIFKESEVPMKKG